MRACVVSNCITPQTQWLSISSPLPEKIVGKTFAVPKIACDSLSIGVASLEVLAMRAMPNFLHRMANTDANAVAGESVGLDTLARRHRNALLRYFQHNLGHPEDAEDLTQEVFTRFAQIDPPPAITNYEAYLFRIASNLLRDRFRRNLTHHVFQHLPASECADELLGEAPSEERVYEEQERLRIFLRALDELSPRCREVFLLQRYEGMTYSAIAQRLGISVSAVEKHMMKALLHLSTQLEPT